MSVSPSVQELPVAAGLAALEVTGLSAGYRETAALQDVSFSVPRGSLLAVVGPNGAGKSTLFKVILGLVAPWKGSVHVLGRPVREARGLVAYTPQVELVDWSFPVTVFDVVLMGSYSRLGLFRRPGKAEREAARRALEKVRLTDMAERQIGELSGGQQRRVLLARALASDPEVMLLDEPMTGLDATAQHDMIKLFHVLTAEGRTVIAATHDLSCVAAEFKLALLLNRRVVAFGPPREAMTQAMLNETFQRHMLWVNVDGRIFIVHG